MDNLRRAWIPTIWLFSEIGNEVWSFRSSKIYWTALTMHILTTYYDQLKIETSEDDPDLHLASVKQRFLQLLRIACLFNIWRRNILHSIATFTGIVVSSMRNYFYANEHVSFSTLFTLIVWLKNPKNMITFSESVWPFGWYANI